MIMVTIPAVDTPDDIILGPWREALVEATACHLELGPKPWKFGTKQLRENFFHSAEAQNALEWAGWMEGRDFRDNGLSLVLANPNLHEAWAWLNTWWCDDYLPRHPHIALREAMSDVACAQEFSSWMANTEIVAWQLLHGEIDGAASFWRGEVRFLPEIAADLKRLHAIVDGWWIEGSAAQNWDPVFISRAEWNQLLAEKWEWTAK